MLVTFATIAALTADVVGAAEAQRVEVRGHALVTEEGTVESQQVDVRGHVLVTESVVRLDDGGTTTVRHLGGTLDGIGVRVADQPTLRLGERVVFLREGHWLRAAATLGAARRSFVQATTNRAGSPLFWEGTNCLEIVPNAAGTEDLTLDEALGALERAAENWNEATADCGFMTLTVGAPRGDAIPGYTTSGTNDNIVMWREDEWPEDYPPLAAALTTLHFIDDPGSPDDGKIFDVDIEVNSVGFRFAVDCVEGQGEIDLESTLTHELGHLLGLDHTCADPLPGEDPPLNHLGEPVPSCYGELPDEVRLATMYTTSRGCDTFMRTPEEDDVLGICAMYPLAADPGVCEEPDPPNGGGGGGCAMGGDRSPAGSGSVAAFLGLCVWLSRRACSRSRRRSGCAAARAGRARSCGAA